MYLAVKEMLHEKFRYGLIIFVIFLVTYLLIILTGLASGLSNLNKSAVNEWNAKYIVLNKDSEGRLGQSFLTPAMLKAVGSEGVEISQYSTLVKSQNNLKENAQILAVNSDSFIIKNLNVTEGKKSLNHSSALVSNKFRADGFKLGDYITVANSDVKLKIAGFISEATLSGIPVVYTNFDAIKKLNNSAINGVLFNSSGPNLKSNSELTKINMSEFINKLPGYSAQQTTFNFMIYFLYIIIMLVISIFLYILTVQKLSNIGVLKAQGVSTKYLVKTIVFQALIMSVLGIIVALGLAEVTGKILPSEVPILIENKSILINTIGIVCMSLLGAIVPIYQIARVDPYKIIGG